jgi:hypothetical protein
VHLVVLQATTVLMLKQELVLFLVSLFLELLFQLVVEYLLSFLSLVLHQRLLQFQWVRLVL